MYNGIMWNLSGANKLKMVLLLLSLAIFMVGCNSSSKSMTIYQEGNKLVVTNGEESALYFDDIVDYSYDDTCRLLFVLHGERSGYIDDVGYEAALEEGLLVGGFIRVYQLPDTLLEAPILVYENDFTRVNPWSIDVGDFEQDDMPELFVGCYRETLFYEADRRPFIVTWDGGKIIRKWTGSYIGFDSFLTGEIKDINGDGYDELVLSVVNRSGEIEERAYRWGDFTFDRLELFND